MKFGIFILTLMLIFSTSAYAGDSKFYVSGTLGAMWMEDTRFEDYDTKWERYNSGQWSIHSDYKDMEAEMDFSAAYLVAAGKEFNKSFRVEFEYGFRNAAFLEIKGDAHFYQSDLDPFECKGREKDSFCDHSTPDSIAEFNQYIKGYGEHDLEEISVKQGKVDIYSFMANIIKDYHWLYAGAGIGVAVTDYELKSEETWASTRYYTDAPEDTALSYSINLHKPFQKERTISVDLAWQVMAGVQFELTEKIKTTMGYRLFAVDNDLEVMTHAGEFGLRYSF